MKRINGPLYPGEHFITRTPDISNANVARVLREQLAETQSKYYFANAPMVRALADALDARPDDVVQIRREERERYDADREHMALRIRQAESVARMLREQLAELATYQAPAPIILQVPDAPPSVTWAERIERAETAYRDADDDGETPTDAMDSALRASCPELLP